MSLNAHGELFDSAMKPDENQPDFDEELFHDDSRNAENDADLVESEADPGEDHEAAKNEEQRLTAVVNQMDKWATMAWCFGNKAPKNKASSSGLGAKPKKKANQ